MRASLSIRLLILGLGLILCTVPSLSQEKPPLSQQAKAGQVESSGHNPGRGSAPGSAQSDQPAQHILFIGDSLTQGYGVEKDKAYPAIIEQKLKKAGKNIKITNAGISGSVTAEADRRLKWYLKAKPDVLVLALGANDALKGTPPAVIKGNLAKAIDLAKSHKVRVILAGIQIFANYGDDYRKEFEAVYKDLAAEKQVALIPFLLEGVALDRKLNLSDGKHPNAEGHAKVAETVMKSLEPFL